MASSRGKAALLLTLQVSEMGGERTLPDRLVNVRACSHSVRMTQACCATFRSVSNGWPDLPVATDPREDEIALAHLPIRWRPHVGVFCLNNMAIFHCPWCGSRLPEKRDAALARAHETGLVIELSAQGAIRVGGERHNGDLAELLARFDLPPAFKE